MQSLIKKIANTKFGILLRNTLHIKPIYLKVFEKNYPTTVSDAFLWRTDNGYKTKFKYSDILNLFYKIKNSWVEFHFYSRNNELIKIERVDNLNLSNEIEITSEYLNNIQDYGVFYIYHFSENKSDLESKNIISNRCYLGYAQNNNLYSFVHGNTRARYTGINLKKDISSDIVKTSLFKNYKYTIQKYFNNFNKNELFFINPTSKIIKFSLEDKKYILNSGCTKLIEPKNSIVSIKKTNCLFLRPTVFSYEGDFLDVHHS